MKTRIGILLTVVVFIPWTLGLYAGDYNGGNGTSGDPWQIANIDDLLELSTTPADWNNYNFYFIQTADIDASQTQYWDDSDDNSNGNPYDDPNDETADGNNEGFSPIGTGESDALRFMGSYDGQGHVISNLYINRTGTDYIGFIGRTHCAKIKNLGLTNVDIDGHARVGGLVGYAEGGSITSCYSSGTVHSSGGSTGGLAGKLQSLSVSNSYSSCGVSSTANIGGGFAGFISGSSEYPMAINRCYASGNVSVYTSSDISTCGGFAGYIPSGGGCTVYDCYSTGNVNAEQKVGGFVGECDQGYCIYRCFSSGSVSGWTGYGYDTGAFVGHGGGASNSFFDAETDNLGTTSSGSESGGAIGKTTLQMKKLDTFTGAGWDFEGEDAIWDMDLSRSINSGYPFLSWENGTEVALPITLASFEAVAMNGAVFVTWVTESETENAAFRLYRDEELIAEIEGAGTTSEPHSYSFTDRFVIPGRTYVYVLADVDLQGKETRHNEVKVEVALLRQGFEASYNIGSAYPNPFNPTTVVPLNLAKNAAVRALLYDIRGKAVRELINGDLSAGSHALKIDGAGLSTGIYLVKIQINDALHVQKIALMK